MFCETFEECHKKKLGIIFNTSNFSTINNPTANYNTVIFSTSNYSPINSPINRPTANYSIILNFVCVNFNTFEGPQQRFIIH